MTDPNTPERVLAAMTLVASWSDGDPTITFTLTCGDGFTCEYEAGTPGEAAEIASRVEEGRVNLGVLNGSLWMGW